MDLASVDAGEPGGAGEPEGPLGREVLIFGRTADLEIRVEELAAAVGTIAYEIFTGIGSRVERVPMES
jgi:alanine racemase